jgi:predicted GNAT family acetyltransferase
MLIIVPADEEMTARCCAHAGLQGSVLSMTDGGEWRGYCLYTYNQDRLMIHRTETDDELLGEGLVRSAVNIANNRAVPVAVCEDLRFESMLHRLGFVDAVGGLSVQVQDFFKPCCCGCAHKKEET